MSTSVDVWVVVRAAGNTYHRIMSTPAIDITKLAPQERLRLIRDLWESLRADPAAVPLTPAQQAELDRRLDRLDDGDVELVAWDEVKRRLTAHLE
jgi:putative addiction module component (TIGR02574 family)